MSGEIKFIISRIDKNNDGIISMEEIKNTEGVPSVWLEKIKNMAGENDIPVSTVIEGLEVEHCTSDTDDNVDSDNKYTDKEEFFPYEQNFSLIEQVQSFDDLPTGSHNDIKDARRCDISALNLTKEQLLNLTIDKTTVMSEEQSSIIDEYTEKMKTPGLGIFIND